LIVDNPFGLILSKPCASALRQARNRQRPSSAWTVRCVHGKAETAL